MRFAEKYDKPVLGLVTGALLPIVGFFLSYWVKYYPRSLGGYWHQFIHNKSEQTQIFTFSMIPSLLLFYFILFRWKMEIASKTFVGISIVYVTVYVYLNFFG